MTLSDPLNPLTLQTQTDSLTSNGKTVSRAFDKAALTITATSAAGRQRGHYSRWPSRMPLRKWVSTGLPAWLLIVLVAIPLWAMFYLAAFSGSESVARTSGCTVKLDRTFTCFEESGGEE